MSHVRKKMEMQHLDIDVPFADEVQFYANPETKEIIHKHTEFLGKGWYAIYVNGKLVKKSRDTYFKVPSGFKEVSLFSETSYHSKLGRKGKITRYGTHNYNIQFSNYKPIGKYKLISPVKTQLKSKFAKPISSVELQKWNFMALNWKPEGDKIKLFIEHSVHTPFDKKEIYKSKEYDISEKKQAIQDFRDYVEKHKEVE
jgi:hypothetical protein